MTEIKGTRPVEAPIPSEDGYYWMRFANARYVHVDGGHNYWTWEQPEIDVQMVELSEGFVNWMGSDEGTSLNRTLTVMIEVIGKIEKPS